MNQNLSSVYDTSKQDQRNCELICFPSNRRIGRVREIIQRYLATPSGAQNAVIRSARDGLEKSLRNRGFPPAEIERQWGLFFHVLEAEFQRVTSSLARQEEAARTAQEAALARETQHKHARQSGEPFEGQRDLLRDGAA